MRHVHATILIYFFYLSYQNYEINALLYLSLKGCLFFIVFFVYSMFNGL